MTALIVALVLGGCAPMTGSPEPSAGSEAPTTESTGTPAQGRTAVLPPLPTPPPKERPAPPVDPAKLVGLTQDETKRLIGPPTGVREEPPAVVWSYGSAGCGLDIYFYLDLATQTFRALTYDLKPKGARGLAGSACLASLHTGNHD